MSIESKTTRFIKAMAGFKSNKSIDDGELAKALFDLDLVIKKSKSQIEHEIKKGIIPAGATIFSPDVYNHERKISIIKRKNNKKETREKNLRTFYFSQLRKLAWEISKDNCFYAGRYSYLQLMMDRELAIHTIATVNSVITNKDLLEEIQIITEILNS